MTETGYGLPEQGAKTNAMEFNRGEVGGMKVFHFDLKKTTTQLFKLLTRVNVKKS